MACVVATGNSALAPVLGSLVPVASSVCAGLDGGQVDVLYIQFKTTDDAASAIDSLAGKLSANEQTWSQGGGSGRYVLVSPDGGPQVYWSYSGLPVVAVATPDTDGSDGQSLTEQDMRTFWQDSLLPQSQG